MADEITADGAQQPKAQAQPLQPLTAAPPSSSALSEPPAVLDDPTLGAQNPGTHAELEKAASLVRDVTGPPVHDSGPDAAVSASGNATPAALDSILESIRVAPRQPIEDMASSNGQTATFPPLGGIDTPKRGRGRPPKRGNLTSNGIAGGDANSAGTPDGDIQGTPGSIGSGRGRGRGGGRPRGSRGRGGGRGGSKRKREDDDDDDEGDASDSSEEVTPIATVTKSGRSIQKPTTFVPPPPSPTGNKRKRFYNRRNLESAVCKSCLRGTSPATNMIVFCDGCNAPYHRYCHHPPIEQAVIDHVDKEWFCSVCESERVVPVPEAQVANFVSFEGASFEVRQKYFANLPPGVMVTLLTRATTLKPDLPVFSPDFKTKTQGQEASAAASTNGHAPTSAASTTYSPSQSLAAGASTTSGAGRNDEGYDPYVHPSTYPRPGHGLMRQLPPEQEDLEGLIDEEDEYQVFTHLYQSQAAAVVAAATNNTSSNDTSRKVAGS